MGKNMKNTGSEKDCFTDHFYNNNNRLPHNNYTVKVKKEIQK